MPIVLRNHVQSNSQTNETVFLGLAMAIHALGAGSWWILADHIQPSTIITAMADLAFTTQLVRNF